MSSRKRVFHAWLTANRGHAQLGARGFLVLCQAILTCCIIVFGDFFPQVPVTATCQLLSATTLFVQWRTGSPIMFLARACCSFVRFLVLVHWATCGRRWLWESCVEEGWSDVRAPFRVVAVIAALRQLANGLSLVLQFALPERGVSQQHGNEQLLYRGCVRLSGFVLQLTRGLLKLTILQNTTFERSTVEVAVNFARCVIIPLEAASLWRQWYTSGAETHVVDIDVRKDESTQRDNDS
eukprot:TRINITY_DN32033_c0_g1_i1.p1 TRINITY_DN32033_c0_g1~~TRINITY_DN32033_c0_g1_i1.p1  ORF type:complete len:238 (-),score=32.06 TRINITY_DN32033_c0_g1_i1:118-831(-)